MKTENLNLVENLNHAMSINLLNSQIKDGINTVPETNADESSEEGLDEFEMDKSLKSTDKDTSA